MSEAEGFTAAYRNAAASGTSIVESDDAGLKIDHNQLESSLRDPTLPLRTRVASRLAQHVQHPKCLDIGCATGGDMALLSSALNGDGQLFGIDLLEAQLEVARGTLPHASFVQGDASALPFEDKFFDCVAASRLMIHIPEFETALHEMIRVMKPGALGVLCEGNMDVGMLMLTTDERCKAVFDAKNAHMRDMCANPLAASRVYRWLLACPMVECVEMRSFSCVIPRPTDYDLNFAMEKQFLGKLVTDGVLEKDKVDYYLEQATGSAAEEGKMVTVMMMFEISFQRRG